MIREWQVLERKPPEDHRIFKVQTNIVLSPGSSTMEVKAISLRDCVIALPFTAGDRVVMVRQYRHGIEKVCLELPGGVVDPADVSPEAAAKRELREETGYEAADYVSIGSCFPHPALINHRCFFILARDARLVCQPHPDHGEELEVVLFGKDEIPGLIQDGLITNGMVQLAFYKYFIRHGAAVL